MAASVCRTLKSVAPLSSGTVRPFAEMMPRVTLSPPSSASAFPIAITSSPTCSLSELPSFATGRPVASTLSTARSLSVERPSTLAFLLVPSVNVTSISPPAPSTTWLFVTMMPSDEITKPVPAPPLSFWLPETAPPVRIATTAGSTFWRMPWMSCGSAIVDVLRELLRPSTGARSPCASTSRPSSRGRCHPAVPPPTRAPMSAPATNCFHAPGGHVGGSGGGGGGRRWPGRRRRGRVPVAATAAAPSRSTGGSRGRYGRLVRSSGPALLGGHRLGRVARTGSPVGRRRRWAGSRSRALRQWFRELFGRLRRHTKASTRFRVPAKPETRLRAVLGTIWRHLPLHSPNG